MQAKSELKYGLQWGETQDDETQGRAAKSSGANTEHGHWDLNAPGARESPLLPPYQSKDFGRYRSRNHSYWHSEFRKGKEITVAPAGAAVVLIPSGKHRDHEIEFHLECTHVAKYQRYL